MDIPRRNQMQQWCEAERAIQDAVQAVENMAADPRLTSAQILLGQARGLVADYVDGVDSPAPRVAAESPDTPDVEELFAALRPLIAGSAVTDAALRNVCDGLRDADFWAVPLNDTTDKPLPDEPPFERLLPEDVPPLLTRVIQAHDKAVLAMKAIPLMAPGSTARYLAARDEFDVAISALGDRMREPVSGSASSAPNNPCAHLSCVHEWQTPAEAGLQLRRFCPKCYASDVEASSAAMNTTLPEDVAMCPSCKAARPRNHLCD